MREFLNGILAFIGAESLTDVEYNSLTIVSAGYEQNTYKALSDVLASRELVSTLQARLFGYFTAKGAVITAAETGRSNILIGGVL